MKKSIKNLIFGHTVDKKSNNSKEIRAKQVFEQVAKRYESTFRDLELYDNGKKELPTTDIFSRLDRLQNS